MYKLVIGNKNYSSWSLRAWILMSQMRIEFEEQQISLRSDRIAEVIRPLSPSGRVPVLHDGEFVVWDTLAIVEYLAERHAQLRIWPEDPQSRALARSACAEMHSGFLALRQAMPMNVSASLPGMGWSLRVQQDIERILELWSRPLANSGGPFLYREFGAVDAFFAPVASRFLTYEVKLPEFANRYIEAIHGTDAMRNWSRLAAQENEFLPEDEPYRKAP